MLHSQGGSVITVLADVAEYGIGRGWQTLTILPGYHVAGMEWGMFTIFARAGTVVFLPVVRSILSPIWTKCGRAVSSTCRWSLR